MAQYQSTAKPMIEPMLIYCHVDPWQQNTKTIIQENGFQNVVYKMAAIVSCPQCVKLSTQNISA